MGNRRTTTIGVSALALLASSLLLLAPGSSDAAVVPPDAAGRVTVPAGFRDTTAIGGISQPVTAAFAPDGTAFIGLQTGVIKSFDFNAASGQFESAATSTDFADLSIPVDNDGDRGLTGITVDPQFPTRPYVYVNYTYNKDPRDGPGGVVPKWGQPGQAFDTCNVGSATLNPVNTGCPVMDRVSRLTAVRGPLGWTMPPGGEHELLSNGCFQFDSHTSGDVVFGPDGKLYASAGEGGSYLGQDFGQANNPCADPANEGGSLRAQDQRTGADPLSVDGTIFRLDPDAGLVPTQASAGQWLVAMGQRNPWRMVFRPGSSQLWSVDVGSSNWEEINALYDAPTTGLVNRGWPCYEGTIGQSVRNPQWEALGKPICQGLYAEGPAAVAAPVYAYRTTNSTRTATEPLTAGESCPSISSAMSGIAFTPQGTGWPTAYQDSLFFSDYLRGCIWRLGKDANGQPDPSKVAVFAQSAGAPVKLLTGPGGDLYYVDYGAFANNDYVTGSGGIHRISYSAASAAATPFQLSSSPKKVKIKVNGQRHRAPYSTAFDAGTVVKVQAPRFYVKKGVRYAFKTWKGVSGKKARKKRKLTLTVGDDAITLKAVYQRQRR